MRFHFTDEKDPCHDHWAMGAKRQPYHTMDIGHLNLQVKCMSIRPQSLIPATHQNNMQIRLTLKVKNIKNAKISKMGSEGGPPPHHLMEQSDLRLQTKFGSIHQQPHQSNDMSSLSLICISGQIPTCQVPSGHMPKNVGKFPHKGKFPSARWAIAHLGGKIPKEYKPQT